MNPIVAAHETRASSQAKSILSLVFDEVFIDPWPSDTGNYRLAAPLPDETTDLFKLNPNPVKDFCNVAYTVSSEAEVIIYDINGRPLCKYPLKKNDNILIMDLRKFDNGIYLIKVQRGNEIVFNNQFIVIH